MTFEELLRRDGAAVERFVKYRVDSREDAEDILQETYLAAFRHFADLRDEAAFKPWLLQIARRKIADRFRAQPDTVPLEDVPEERFCLTDPGRDAMPAVRDAVERLRERDRQILDLFYWQELTEAQISRRLHIPPGTVKSRLHAARRRFRAAYPHNGKGELYMNKLPEILPEYTIKALDAEPFEVKWEEAPGWLIVPRPGEKLSWALYDMPSRRRTEWTEIRVVGRAEVHGIEGVEVVAVQHDTENYYRTGAIPEIERRFVIELTDTHCRYLAESHNEDGIRKLYTFLDGPAFMNNWGFGPDNLGNETDLKRKGILFRDADTVTGQMSPDLMSQDVVGRYEVTINGRTYDTVCVMDIECFNDEVASEQFIDRSGRTVLWRRFNRDDWAFGRYGKLWSEMLPHNQRLVVNGQTYVHWYDCVSDYVL